MTGGLITLASMSAAMDGGFTAVADVSSAMATTGMTEQHRLIGGVAVMLHVQRLGLTSRFGPPLTPTSGSLLTFYEAQSWSTRSRLSDIGRSPATGGSAPSTSAVSRRSIYSSRPTDPAPVTPSRSGRS